ncbi:MAG: ATP-binding cassette domain-containing protein [Bacteroidia bacterium]|nr:ATP-binding cassette domain-containing protein [Bacteroidia bacterium]
MPSKETQPKKPKLSKESIKEAMAIFAYIRPYRWHLIAGTILLSLSSLVFMIMPKVAGMMVDVAQGANTQFSLDQIGKFLIIVLILQGFVSYARIVLFSYVSEKGVSAVRLALYDKLITLPVTFFEKNKTGELVSRVSTDVDRLYNAFSVIIAEFLRQVIILIAGVVFIAYTTWQLGAIMLATFPFIVIAAYFFGKYIRRFSKKRQAVLAESNTIMSESSYNIHTVKSFTNEWFESNRYKSAILDYIVVAMKFAKVRGTFAAFIVTILSGGIFFIIWQGAKMLQSGILTAGDLVAFVSYTAIIGVAIAGLGNFYTEILGALGATERIREILKSDGEMELRVYEDAKVRLQGDVQFKNVNFVYPSRQDMTVLEDFSLHIHPGEKVALVGASGAGKSTIMQILLRFYNIQGGEILLDGTKHADIELSDYRKNFALVPQEVLLFGGTIKENILYGRPNATEEEVIEAAKKSNSWEFISKFPDGLETIVGERGIKLSGGQRQRIAIARAILKDPAILLLDEATSALDAESELVVQDALNELMKGRTSIIIAHRLATIREVDRIYVMDNGKVIESGSHEELSRINEGAYSNLAKLQFELS